MCFGLVWHPLLPAMLPGTRGSPRTAAVPGEDGRLGGCELEHGAVGRGRAALCPLRSLQAVGASPAASPAASTPPAKVLCWVGPATRADREGSRARERAGRQRVLRGGSGTRLLSRSNGLP